MITPISNEQIIKDYLTQMATQDRRGTADMFYYVIKTSTWKIVDPDYAGSDAKTVFLSDDGESEYASKEKYLEMLREENGDKITLQEAEDLFSELRQVTMDKVWESKGMFLTETDAKHHLLTNKHHYSSDAHTYVEHAWRAYDMRKFFEALFEHFEVKKEWG